MKRVLLSIVVILLVADAARAVDPNKPMLLQRPALSQTHIAFMYAGDLWIVPKEGGEAKRLTSGMGGEGDPNFSPDGTQIAFTGEYDGNVDVYTISAQGGEPKRLTYHPGGDQAVGWTPDGKSVLFRSSRASTSFYVRLFTMPVEGGFPSELPLPSGFDGSYSADGQRIAYMPIIPAFDIWKRYRGGRTTPIWIANLADSAIERIPRDNSNDICPMWIGEKVFFLSDRAGPVTLFSYDLGSKKVTQVMNNDGLDLKSASAGPNGTIVYEQFGTIGLFNTQSNESKKVEIRLSGDFPTTRARFEKVASKIRSAELSPTGARVVFEARGEVLTVPADKGDIRNLTQTTAVVEREPTWSPDGKSIAYFSDESGEYMLYIREQKGTGEPRKISLGDAPSYYYSPVWSPDSKKIAYTDKRLQLWYLEVESGMSKKVDQDSYDKPFRTLDQVWSPDSKWIGYTKQLKSHFRAVFVYSLDSGKTHQVTDGMSDCRFAQFDKNGKYLYFTASTDAGPTTGWLDMSSFSHPVTRNVYVVVLRNDLPSPLQPESDEEKATATETPKPKPETDKADKPAAPTKPADPTAFRIDLENIDQRVLALPIPARNYSRMVAGKSGVLFLVEMPAGLAGIRAMMGEAAGFTLSKFDMTTKKFDKVMDGIQTFDLSSNGEKMLYRLAGPGDRWVVAPAGAPAAGGGMAALLGAGGGAAGGSPSTHQLKLDDMEVYVDPKAEWKQMYREVWRIERDFLYDPTAHGLDLKSTAKKYEPYLENLASRADLNYLFQEMLGELSLGHTYVMGGDAPDTKRVRGGLLGADYKIENGRYRFSRVYHGENWNPQLRAPLTQPGVIVKAGDYLLAVNGKEVKSTDNVYRFFVATSGKQITLKVGPNPDGKDAREVTVVPVDSEMQLRNLAWIEDNRRKVDKMTGGRVGYVYLPDTSIGGFTNFNRYYFSQVGKDGVVIDERFNGGGTAADYIIDYMRRPLMNMWSTREGQDFTTPVGSIYGPKAMIVNEYAGSGGDAMPWYFKEAKVGKLVGKRTWGGLVGIYDYPPLIDGGMVTAPRVAFWRPGGDWEVENAGVPPDVEVEYDPQAVRNGHDPQLEKAVEIVMDELKKNPPPKYHRPAYPNYHKKNGR